MYTSYQGEWVEQGREGGSEEDREGGVREQYSELVGEWGWN